MEFAPGTCLIEVVTFDSRLFQLLRVDFTFKQFDSRFVLFTAPPKSRTKERVRA